jgi:MoxR-like ATPase
MHFLDGLHGTEPLMLAPARSAIDRLREHIVNCSREPQPVNPGIVGQDQLVDRVLCAILLAEHLLLEGNPGLAKTLASKTAGEMAGLAYQRIQFMPDTMPSDLILREVLTYEGRRARIVPKLGPLFTNLLLADEINRASPKTQAGLLEASEERFATPLNYERRVIRPVQPIDEAAALARYGPFFGIPQTFNPDTTDGQVFVVMATQNPIEQEGVYPLSRAMEDRFFMKIIIRYPPGSDLDAISRHAFSNGSTERRPPVNEEVHVRTLYFFHALRQLLIGPDAERRWFGEDNAPLREKVRHLTDFTHVRPGDRDRSGRRAAVPQNGSDDKPEEIRRLRSRWSRLDGPAHLRRREEALSSILGQDDPPFPDVLSGTSPRGLLKLVRAAHVEAFLKRPIPEDGIVRPNWDDVKAVAPDVLRHRIRLTPGCEAMGGKPETVISRLIEWIDQW